MIAAALELLHGLGQGDAANAPLARALLGSGVEPGRIAEAVVAALESAPSSRSQAPGIAFWTGIAAVLGALGGSFGLYQMQQVLSTPWPLFLAPLLPLPWLLAAVLRPRQAHASAAAWAPLLLLKLLAIGLSEELALATTAQVASLPPHKVERLLDPNGPNLASRAAQALDLDPDVRRTPLHSAAVYTGLIVVLFWLCYILSFRQALLGLEAP